MLYDNDGYLIHGIYSSFLFKNRTLVHLGLAEHRATWLETTFFFFFFWSSWFGNVSRVEFYNIPWSYISYVRDFWPQKFSLIHKSPSVFWKSVLREHSPCEHQRMRITPANGNGFETF